MRKCFFGILRPEAIAGHFFDARLHFLAGTRNIITSFDLLRAPGGFGLAQVAARAPIHFILTLPAISTALI